MLDRTNYSRSALWAVLLVRELPSRPALPPSTRRGGYVDERNTSDVAVIAVDTSGGTIALTVDGAAIPRLLSDPMPAAVRHGQLLFNTANGDLVPVTKTS